VKKYLESKFGEALEEVSNAGRELAKSFPPTQLAQKAYALYEKFRPEIPPGKKGWGLRQAGFRAHRKDGFGLTLSYAVAYHCFSGLVGLEKAHSPEK